MGESVPVVSDGFSPGSARGHLLRNMVLFGRLLRAGGLDVTPAQMTDWVEALRFVELLDPRDFRAASRSILVRRQADLAWFEAAFDLFWQARDPRELAELELGLLVQRTTEKTQRSALQKLELQHDADDGEDSNEPPLEAAAYSEREQLRRKDFAQLSAEELAEIKRLMSRLRWNLQTRRSRRHVPFRRGHRPDLRRTLRRNLSRGGELLPLHKRQRKRKKRPLILLCDISGSMEPYSRLLLHFVYALSNQDSAQHGLEKIEAFVFGTRLTRITQFLRESDPDRALQAATRQIEDWGGGTRTGESLQIFNVEWSRRVLGQGAVVLVISDGWDRGDIDLLGREIDRLHRSCHRLIWLNPLLGSPGYEPLTRGMQAALPHIDEFLPVHNLHSLEQLGRVLERLG